MNRRQLTAIANHCRLAIETPNPKFRHQLESNVSLVLTVNSGWE